MSYKKVRLKAKRERENEREESRKAIINVNI